jgi:uncharacterized protein involved in exopolysaccharide biosynthesis
MEQRPELIDYLRVVFRRWRFIAGWTALLTAASVLATFVMTPYYTTEATLLVSWSKVSSEGKEPPRSYADVESYLALLENRSIELDAMEHFHLRGKPWELTLPKFSRLVTARRVPDTDLVSLELSFPDPDQSLQIATYLVDKAIEANRALNQGEARDTQKFLEQELDQARQRRERLNAELAAALKSSNSSALEARLKAFEKTFGELETQRREAQAAVSEAEASMLGFLVRPGLHAKLQSLEETVLDLQTRADAWSQELATRRQTIQELRDRYESADRTYRELALRSNEASVLVGSRSQNLKLIDAPYRPERPSWPRHWLVAAVAGQLALAGTTLAAFLLDYIAARRSRL